MSNYAKTAQVNWLLHDSAASFSVAIFVVNPNFASGLGGTEAAGGNYARQPVIFSTTLNGQAFSANQQQWTAGLNIAAGTYAGWAVYDSENRLIFGAPFAAPVTLEAGDSLSFKSGSISYTLHG
jgi:hypothetical protein